MINHPMTSYENLHQFNDEFEKIVENFGNKWQGRSIKNLPSDDRDLQSILNVLEKNQTLFSPQNERKEINRFIKIARNIYSLTNDECILSNLHLSHILITSTLVSLNLKKDCMHESLYRLDKLKTNNDTFFWDAMATWVNSEQIQLNQLPGHLTNEQLLQLAPRLTYFSVTKTRFSEEFIEKLFQKAEQLKYIIIKNNSEITGKCFNFLKKVDSLQSLVLEECPLFNHPLPSDLPLLHTLEIHRCDAFNQQPPNDLPSLQALEITHCGAFNQRLPKHLNLLKKIFIWNCKEFNRRLPGSLPSLEEIGIINCNTFNHQLPLSLPSLHTMKITCCETFNQPLPNIVPLLKTLEIVNCHQFDQQLPNDLPALQTLEIDQCNAFNHQLPGTLCSLLTLKISQCCTFNQQLPNDLSLLQTLVISHCKTFNKQFPTNLPKAVKLSILECKSFNQTLPYHLPYLTELNLVKCRSFNQKLPNKLPSLKVLNVDCKKLEPFSHPIHTAVILSIFKKEFIKDKWGQLSQEDKKQKIIEIFRAPDLIEMYLCHSPARLYHFIEVFGVSIDTLKINYPQGLLFFTLADIEYQRTQGASRDEIIALFNSLQDQINYFDTLKIMVSQFPSLSLFLIKEQRDKLLIDLEKLKISFKELSMELKWELLPLLEPDDIHQMILNSNEEDVDKWLKETIQYDRFSGSINGVLGRFASANLVQASPETVDSLYSIVEEFLLKIPLKTLAVFTKDIKNLKTVFLYFPFMNEYQKAVVIPVLPKEAFIDYVKKQLLSTHSEKLVHATQSQKELYLEQGNVKDFADSLKLTLTGIKQRIEAIPSPGELEKLKKDFDRLLTSTWQQIHSNPLILHKIEEVLLKEDSAPLEFCEKVEAYVEDNNSTMTWIKNEMTEIDKMLNSQQEDTPSEFLDVISGAIMTDPYKDETYGHILDKTSWERLKKESEGINPFNRQPMGKLIQANELRKEIEKYTCSLESRKKSRKR